jgi:hypothetical protein
MAWHGLFKKLEKHTVEKRLCGGEIVVPRPSFTLTGQYGLRQDANDSVSLGL